MLGDTDVLDEVLGIADSAPAEAESVAAAAADFRGSLDYIDSLNTDAPWAKLTRSTLSRDAGAIANVGVLDSLLNPSDVVTVHPSDFRDISDRRQFHPMGDAAPIGVTRRTAAEWRAPNQREFEEQERRLREIEAPYRRKFGFDKSNLGQVRFRDPRRNVICLKRKIRREVFMAYRLWSKARFTRRRFRWYSQVYC